MFQILFVMTAGNYLVETLDGGDSDVYVVSMDMIFLLLHHTAYHKSVLIKKEVFN